MHSILYRAYSVISNGDKKNEILKYLGVEEAG